MAFAFLNRFFGSSDDRDEWRPLYAAIVEQARQPHWYQAGQVADTIDGRFGMVTLVTSLVLLRLEDLGDVASGPMARLTEVLVEDMEGQVREIGFGDLVVGKQVGQMMGALGGRIGAYRLALADNGDLKAALQRNLYGAAIPADEAMSHVAERARAFVLSLSTQTLEDFKRGRLAK
jgi:cytochrome b pre-mRNA-processing protein 3